VFTHHLDLSLPDLTDGRLLYSTCFVELGAGPASSKHARARGEEAESKNLAGFRRYECWDAYC
jgi:hypothetical protein